METNNFDQTLKAFQKRTPFQPFTVALVNGDRFEVDRPEALVIRDGMAAFIGAGGVPVLFNHEQVSQIIDSQTRKEYVLVRREVYDRFKKLFDEDDARLMYPGLAYIDPEDWEDAAVYEGKS